ncbi:MAG TPA: T9SS type A sorting domain-containing protein, partial [Ignavibacteriaceae bacterium]|nr:T9SS type A sorting domain-containing protein [Ignavibacteriaceae bacterium]
YSEVVNVLVGSLDKYALGQNYPNPFNPSTTIGYILKDKSNVKLSVFNSLGEEIAILVNGQQEQGYYEVNFDAAGLPSGIYYYMINTGNFTQTKKMLLIK